MIAIDICQCWIEAAGSIGKEKSKILELFDMGRSFIMNGSYSIGFPLIEKAFIQCDKTMKHSEPVSVPHDETENNHDLVVLIISTFFALLAISLIIGFILIIRKK
jgi:hypothetical protein